MAITAACVFQGRNLLRYLCTQDGAAGTTVVITTDGAATPDVQTDSVQGPLKALCAFNPTFAAGARNLWLSDPTGGAIVEVPGFGRANAICQITPRTGAIAGPWLVQVDVGGDNNAEITVTGPAAASTAYLDIEVPNQIGA